MKRVHTSSKKASVRYARASVTAKNLASAGAVQGKEGKFEAIYTYLMHFIGMAGPASSTRLPSRVRVPGIGTSGATSMVICACSDVKSRVTAQSNICLENFIRTNGSVGHKGSSRSASDAASKKGRFCNLSAQLTFLDNRLK